MVVAVACAVTTQEPTAEQGTGEGATARQSIPPTTVGGSVAAPTSSLATTDPDPETRPMILALAGPQLGGGTFDPQTVAGRDVLLWFWAPW